MQWQGACDISYIDRALCLAYSQGCKNALVICEEHELNNMPAQLTITPIINFKVAREHEKLIEIYYGSNDGDNLNQLVEVIRSIVEEIGGAQEIDSKILFNHDEEIAQESFLFTRGEQLASKLKACAFSILPTSTKNVLEGADIFGHSSLYEESIVYVKKNRFWG